MKGKDTVGFRDAELRKRLDQLVMESNGAISLSWIIRTALEEKLAQLEAKGLGQVFGSSVITEQPQAAYQSKKPVKITHQPGAGRIQASKRKAS